MDPQVLALSTTVAGVLIGGGISFAAQRYMLKANDKIDQRRLTSAWREARRGERVLRFDAFLQAAQEVERAAIDRHHNGRSEESWIREADSTVDKIWVQQKLIDILCPELRDATFEFANALQDVLLKGPGDTEVWSYLNPYRNSFLDAARQELENHGGRL